jgi:DNA polymerase elongation subunit (family B)
VTHPETRAYVNAYVSGDSLVTVSRDENGARKIEHLPAEYVFYLRGKDTTDETHRTLRTSESITSARREGSWYRYATRHAWQRTDLVRSKFSPIVKQGLATYEGDVDPVRRWITDSGARIAKPRTAYLDLETDSRVKFAYKESARILSWVVTTSTEQVTTGVLAANTNSAEKILLGDLWKHLRDFDQVVAWNGGERGKRGVWRGFDFPVLFARSEENRIAQVNPREWLYLDHMIGFERMNKQVAESGDEKQSMALENIAMSQIGEGKEKHHPKIAERFGTKDSMGALAWQLWEAGGEYRDLLVKYMIKDGLLLPKIEAKTEYLATFQAIAEVCSVFPDYSGLKPMRQMDGFMLKLAAARDYHFPTRKEHLDDEGDDEQFAGAYVQEPTFEGIERDVHVCDFAGLYPSIIRTWNMSPETKADIPREGPIPAGYCRAPGTGIGFSTATRGILPTALDEMVRLRKVYRDLKATLPPGTPEAHAADRQSNAYKVCANSFYGVVGAKVSRYYDVEVAESVTQTGVWLLKKTIREATRRGIKTKYADTDGAYCVGVETDEFRNFVKHCNVDVYPIAIANQGCVLNFVSLDYEKEFSVLVFCAKKKYVGRFRHYKGTVPDATSKPEIKGLEFKKGDAVRLARALQGEVIDLLMSGHETADEFESVLNRARDHILKDALEMDDIRRTQSIRKDDLDDYKTKEKKDGTMSSPPAHIVVAKILEERGEDVSSGTRIDYIVVDGSARPLKCIPAADFTGEFDRHYLWEDWVFPATQRLLVAAFKNHDWTSWAKTRPAKPRRRKSAQEPEGQLGFLTQEDARPSSEVPAVAPFRRPGRAFTIEIAEKDSAVRFEEIKQHLRKHPGETPVEIIIRLNSGKSAVLATPLRIRPSHELSRALKLTSAA